MAELEPARGVSDEARGAGSRRARQSVGDLLLAGAPGCGPGREAWCAGQLRRCSRADSVRTMDGLGLDPDVARFFTTDPWGNRIELLSTAA